MEVPEGVSAEIAAVATDAVLTPYHAIKTRVRERQRDREGLIESVKKSGMLPIIGKYVLGGLVQILNLNFGLKTKNPA